MITAMKLATTRSSRALTSSCLPPWPGLTPLPGGRRPGRDVRRVRARELFTFRPEARQLLENGVPKGLIGTHLDRGAGRRLHAEHLPDQPLADPGLGDVADRSGVADGHA